MRLIGLAWTLPITACVLAGCTSTSVTSSTEARSVYCLVDAEASKLIRVAATLGVAQPGLDDGTLIPVPGSTAITTSQWQKLYPQKFQRACTVLIAADEFASPTLRTSTAISSSLQSTLNILLPVIVGAILALLTTQWTGNRQRRRLEAAEVRTSFTAFAHSLTDYATAWSAPTILTPPTTQELDQRRRDLVTILRRIVALHRSARFAGTLLQDLDSDKYRTQLENGWSTNDPPSRRKRAERVDQLAGALQTDSERLARLVERSFNIGSRDKEPTPSSIQLDTA